MKISNQKGVSLLLTILIMAALLAIAIGVTRLSLGEIKLIRDIPNSLIAYYAADSGIERALYEERIGGGAADQADCSVNLDNDSKYGVNVSQIGETVVIKSTGCYKDIRRAIEVSF
ncbi:unnamed protein product [marine sediment metagenome]|uniref:Type 4 fimbrial biogenesis protein PilX N-terminal domain-containing protein n=1 Tax=marine sediment metagenome TaxID=412755 RepID=X1NAZ2_9ZZZZ